MSAASRYPRLGDVRDRQGCARRAGGDQEAFVTPLPEDAWTTARNWRSDVASDDMIAIVKEATGGRGADVIIDPVGGDVFDASYRCAAPEGRSLSIGFTSGRIPELRLNQVLLRNIAVIGVNALFYKDQWSEFLAEIVELYSAGAAELR